MGRGLPFVKGGRGGRAEAPPQNNTSGGDLGEPRGGAEGWETPPPPQILGLPPPPLTHAVIGGAGELTQLPLEVQVDGEVEVTLGGRGGGTN